MPALRGIVRRSELRGASESRAAARVHRWEAGRKRAGQESSSDASDGGAPAAAEDGADHDDSD